MPTQGRGNGIRSAWLLNQRRGRTRNFELLFRSAPADDAASTAIWNDWVFEAATGVSATANGVTFTETHSLIVGAASAASQATGATLTETLSLIAGSASGGALIDATANGVTLTYSTAMIAGSASASSQAAGATLTQTRSLITGAAQASSQATGATLTTTQALIAGAAQADSQAAGQTVSYAYALLKGIASGDIAPVTIRRGDDGGWRPDQRDIGARDRFWAKKAEDWLETKLEQLPRVAKKAKAKRAAILDDYEDDAAEYLTEFPEYAPRINAVTALMESLAQPYTDYAALMVAIEAQQALVAAQRRARRRARDIEALLLLDA